MEQEMTWREWHVTKECHVGKDPKPRMAVREKIGRECREGKDVELGISLKEELGTGNIME